MVVHYYGKAHWIRAFATTKLLLSMKLTILFTTVAFLNVQAHVNAQKVTLSQQNASLEQVFKEIERQTGCNFFYNNKIIRQAGKVTIQVREASLQDVLEACFKNQPLEYVIQGNIIIVSKKEKAIPIGEQAMPPPVDVSGRITDEEGRPLQGVSVSVKGAAKGTSTDADGFYTLKGVNENATLQITYVGYSRQLIPVNKRPVINITMALETKLEETVVVTYGTQRRKELVGSISQVKAADVKDMPTGTFAERLQGKFPGVQINNTTGRPNQGVDFRIRGAASFYASNAPLFVVDGIPMTGENDNIATISPDEIETFTVLKDASATALYGSRAANGIIMITTKQGKAGQTKIELNAYYGIATFPNERKPQYMNATELASYMKGFFEDKIKYENYAGGIPAEYQDPEQYGEGTDWFGIMLRHAPVQNYSLSVSTARDRSSMSIVGGYFNQQGIIKNTGYQRFSVRMNNEFRPIDGLKIGVNLAPTVQVEHNNRISTDGQRQIIAGALYSPPMAPAFNPDGTLALKISGYTNLFNWPNWYRKLLETQDDIAKLRLLGNAYTEIRLLKDFTFRTQIGIDIAALGRKTFLPTTAQGGLNVVPPQPATGSSSFNTNYSWINENTLTYQTTVGNDHNLEALVGFSSQKWNSYSNIINGNTFPNDDVPYMNYASVISSWGSGSEAWTLLSLISRVNYNYKGRYFLQGAIRRDGSSRFGADNRWGYFPSVGAGWIISDENFMKDLRGLTFLKLRASYGVTGNNNFTNLPNNISGNYPAIALLGRNDYVFGSTLAQGLSQSNLANLKLGWEKNKQFDLGVDIGLWNDRINITYDYYRKITDGLLYRIDIPHGSGFTSVMANIGTVRYWGHEIAVSSKNLNGPLQWNTTVSVSFDRNKVTKLGTNDVPFSTVGSNTFSEFTDWRTEVGRPLGLFYGYIYDGVFMNQAELDKGPKHTSSKPGTVRMKDLNGDGFIDAVNDRTFIGDPNPDFIFGITNTFRYKSFDLNIVVSGSYGNDIKDGMAESSYNLDGVFNGPKELLGRWRSEQDPGNGHIPRTLAGTTTLFRADNTYFIHDGSHITANNITLGYNITRFGSLRYLKNCRLYVSVQQAFVITSYPGMNPEIGGLNGTSQGQDFGNYPVPRTYTLGINLGL